MKIGFYVETKKVDYYETDVPDPHEDLTMEQVELVMRAQQLGMMLNEATPISTVRCYSMLSDEPFVVVE